MVPLIGIGIVVLVIITVVRSGRRTADPPPPPESYAGRVVTSHRIKCPECDEWATLMVYDTGRRRRICDGGDHDTWL